MREIVQKKFLDEIIGAASLKSSGWMILVLDAEATRVISSVLTMYDIMERKITLVEQLGISRQPFPDMDVIYLVSAKADSFKKICADFKGPGKPKYGNVHIFTLTAVSDADMKIFRGCEPLLDRIQTFTEAQIDFLCTESNVFHFDYASSLRQVFVARDALFGFEVASKLTSLCITLNEFPVIRYQQGSEFTKAIATFVHKNLQDYKSRNPSHWTHGDDAHSDRERGVLLVIDRTFDPLTPLMHDYTYQTLAEDLLPITDNVIPIKVTTNAGEVQMKDALLSESDELWVELRHLHIAKVIKVISDRMRDIIQNNNSANLLKGSGADMTLTAMASAVKELPEYRQTLTKLNQHISIAQQCMDSFTKQGVWEASQLEQFMSTGVDSNNSLLKKANLMSELVENLENPKLSQLSKLRLLAVFFATQSRISSVEERNSLVKTAKLTPIEHNALKNLERIAQDFVPPTMSEKVEKKSKGFFTQFFNTTSDGVVTGAEGEIADSRHLTALHYVLEKILIGELPATNYPPVDSSMGASKAVAKSARRAGGGHNKFAGKKQVYSGSRTIVFIAGGLSYIEMRVAYDDMHKHSKEVIIGGTHLITPELYLEELKSLHMDVKVSSKRATDFEENFDTVQV